MSQFSTDDRLVIMGNSNPNGGIAKMQPLSPSPLWYYSSPLRVVSGHPRHFIGKGKPPKRQRKWPFLPPMLLTRHYLLFEGVAGWAVIFPI